MQDIIYGVLSIGLLISLVYLVVKCASYVGVLEMRETFGLNVDMDLQYHSTVIKALRASNYKTELAAKILEKEVAGTILEIGGRNYLMDVSAARNGGER